MKGKMLFKLIALIVVQGLFISCAWAYGGAISYECLSPEVQMKTSRFVENFNALSKDLIQKSETEKLISELNLESDSPVAFLLRELGVKISSDVRNMSQDNISVVFEKTDILKEELEFDEKLYAAELLTHDGVPLLLYIATGFNPMENYRRRYFLDFSALLNVNETEDEGRARKKLLQQLRTKRNERVFSRIQARTVSCEIYTLENGENVPVLFNVHPPNDEPSTYLIEKTKDRVNASDNILDIGTGTGKVGAILAKNHGVTAVSIDHKKTEIANAKITAAAFGVSDKMEVLESDLFSALTGRKFNKMYFYPPTTKTNKMSAAEFFGVKEGAAVVNKGLSEKLFDRLFNEFDAYLEEEGILYLALMKNNDVAYEKMDEYSKNGKITSEVIYSHVDDDGISFEIFEIRPTQYTASVLSLASRLSLPSQEKIDEVRAYIKTKLGLKKIRNIYLHGSARWYANPDDWDVVIFTRDPDNQQVYDSGKLTNGPIDIDYRVINLHALYRGGELTFNNKISTYLINIYLMGKSIEGTHIIKTILNELELNTPLIYLNSAGHMLNVSRTFTDVIDAEMRLLERKPDAVPILAESNRKNSLSNAGKSVFNAALFIREALNNEEFNLDLEFYSLDEIFGFWQKAKEKTLTHDELNTFRKNTDLAISELMSQVINDESSSIDKKEFSLPLEVLEQAI